MSTDFPAFLYLNAFLASFRIRPVKKFIYSKQILCIYLFLHMNMYHKCGTLKKRTR